MSRTAQRFTTLAALKAAVRAVCLVEFERFERRPWHPVFALQYGANQGTKRVVRTELDRRASEILADVHRAVGAAMALAGEVAEWGNGLAAEEENSNPLESGDLEHRCRVAEWGSEFRRSPVAQLFQDRVPQLLSPLVASPLLDPAGFTPRDEFEVRSYIAAQLCAAGPRSDRSLAVVSLLCGNWPAGRWQDWTASDAIVAETKAMRKARQRESARLNPEGVNK